jgi:hypothetical protein
MSAMCLERRTPAVAELCLAENTHRPLFRRKVNGMASVATVASAAGARFEAISCSSSADHYARNLSIKRKLFRRTSV